MNLLAPMLPSHRGFPIGENQDGRIETSQLRRMIKRKETFLIFFENLLEREDFPALSIVFQRLYYMDLVCLKVQSDL